MTKTRKLLASLLVVGAVGAIAAFGVFSAFTSTTQNPGNNITAGTVTIGDNDAGSALYAVTNGKPGSTVTKCITITYSGSLDADVKLYTADSIGALGQYVDLTIQPGNFPDPDNPPASMGCTGFSADGGAIFNNTLQNFATNHNSYANGLVDNPGSTTKWATGNKVAYQVTATLQSGAPNSAQNATTNSHAFTWEARNQ
jgi:camelysin-like metallo-endopeptidase